VVQGKGLQIVYDRLLVKVEGLKASG
jgi:hypothetical protein